MAEKAITWVGSSRTTHALRSCGHTDELQVEPKLSTMTSGNLLFVLFKQCLKISLANNDKLLIVDITKQKRQGWLPKKAWDWIRENE